MSSQRRILLITDHLPGQAGAGGTAYPHLLLSAIHQRFGWVVDAICLQTLGKAPALTRTPTRERYIETCFHPWRVQVAGMAIGGKIAFHLAQKPWDFVRKWCEDHPRQPVIMNGTQRADWLKQVPDTHRGVRLVFTHEVIHQRVEFFRSAGVEPDFEPLTRDHEMELLQLADAVGAIQREDAAELAHMVGQGRIVHLPPPFPSCPLPSDSSKEGRCLFIGGKAQTNQVGLNWFLEHCWSDVRTRFPNASLHICGSVGECVRTPVPDGVTIAGKVDDLAPYYAEAAVCIAPLQFGSGVKLKLLEAAAYGRAVVATSVGLQGLANWDVDAVWRADSPADFASAIVHLLQHPADRIRRAENQLSLLRIDHDPDTIAQTLHECLIRNLPS